MMVRALDVNGDWEFGKGKNSYKRNAKAVSQNVGTRLKSFLGDCFFALDAGIDWFNLLGGKDSRAITLAVSSVILNTLEVESIIALSVNLSQTRVITLTYEVETVYGRTAGFIEQNVG